MKETIKIILNKENFIILECISSVPLARNRRDPLRNKDWDQFAEEDEKKKNVLSILFN